MMVEFTSVVSSTGLYEKPVEPNEPVAVGECPRKLLGLACIRNEYDCLCLMIASSSVTIEHNEEGRPFAVNLVLRLADRSMTGPKRVLSSIELTGLVADLEASREQVSARFNLRRPQNQRLRDFFTESES